MKKKSSALLHWNPGVLKQDTNFAMVDLGLKIIFSQQDSAACGKGIMYLIRTEIVDLVDWSGPGTRDIDNETIIKVLIQKEAKEKSKAMVRYLAWKKIKALLNIQRYQRGPQAGILGKECENFVVRVAPGERKFYKSSFL